jgi:hypothetical protein
VSTAAKKIHRLIRTDTNSVCHPSPEGDGGDIGTPRCLSVLDRYSFHRLG